MSAQRQPVLGPMLVDILARLTAVESEVRRLRRTSGPRDRLDVDVLHAIADATGGVPFRARDVFVRAELVDGLDGVLTEAFVTSSKSLGKLLTRCAGMALPDGLIVERLHVRGRSHWRVSVSALS